MAVEYIECLAMIEAFLSDKELRNRFVAFCCMDELEQRWFKTHPTIHIDWKWEFLAHALRELKPRLQILIDRFDVQKMLSGDSGKLSSQVVIACVVVLKLLRLVVKTELLLVVCELFQYYVGKLECCHCHEDV